MKTINSSTGRILTGIAFLFAVFSMSNSCTKDSMSDMPGTGGNSGGSKGPGANEVFIQGMAYSPSTITVAANTTITWTNKDAFPHTVTVKTGPFIFDSGSIGTNSTFSFTFTLTGTYTYICTFHPSMAGTVKVN